MPGFSLPGAPEKFDVVWKRLPYKMSLPARIAGTVSNALESDFRAIF
jgi:hypothetical protein